MISDEPRIGRSAVLALDDQACHQRDPKDHRQPFPAFTRGVVSFPCSHTLTPSTGDRSRSPCPAPTEWADRSRAAPCQRTDTQSRKYQLTLNNPLDKQLDHDALKVKLAQLKSAIYWCMADEIGLEAQTPHTHVFIQLRSPARFSRMLRDLKRAKKSTLPFEARKTAAAELLPRAIGLVHKKKAPSILTEFIKVNLAAIKTDDDWSAFYRHMNAISGFLMAGGDT